MHTLVHGKRQRHPVTQKRGRSTYYLLEAPLALAPQGIRAVGIFLGLAR